WSTRSWHERHCDRCDARSLEPAPSKCSSQSIGRGQRIIGHHAELTAIPKFASECALRLLNLNTHKSWRAHGGLHCELVERHDQTSAQRPKIRRLSGSSLLGRLLHP